MKRKTFLLYVLLLCSYAVSAQNRIGINTNTPKALLHVQDSSVIFSGGTLPALPGNPPAIGAGIRMMWYPAKAAFRVGDPGGTLWNRDSIGSYSFAAGLATKAKGTSSFAVGEQTEALGERSVTMGFNSHATEDYSIAIGRQTTSTGTASVAMGYGTQATGLASFAANYFNTSEGSYSAALGFSTKSVGQMSLATGYDTQADGIVSIASGYRGISSGSYSFAGGFQTNSVPFASVAIGRFNVDSIGNSTQWVDTDPIFMIGNGEDVSTRSNAFTVLKNGKTPVNGSNPAAGVSIKGYDATELSHLQLIDNNSADFASIYYTGHLNFKNSWPSGDFFFRNSANTSMLSIANTGNVTVAGTVTENSDGRLKKDFRPLESSLNKVIQLKGYHYYWKDELRDKDLQTGFVAQDVESIMPELVKTSDDGLKSVNYSGIIPYLAEAIKELKEQNEQLRREIEQLKRNQ